MTDPSSLASRLRTILQATPPGRQTSPAREAAGPIPPSGPWAGDRIDEVVGGVWHGRGGGRCLVIEQAFAADRQHGRFQVGEFAERLDRGVDAAGLLAAGSVGPPFVFFDLETTGLGGGAGACAFLIGLGWFGPDGSFAVRQLLLTRESDERTMLEALRDIAGAAGTLVSFNGRSFDAPMLDMRHAFHRLDWERAGGGRPHLDILHPCRRFWSARTGGSCSLAVLERAVLGTGRSDDVAGFEIPDRYFRYLRSGDPRPLTAVLEHNRLDLLSLAGLAARLTHLVEAGPAAAADAREAVALGDVYRRAGRTASARDAFERALAIGGDPLARVEALRALALAERKALRHAEAARFWNDVLAVPGCPAGMAREATEALAVYHEHRVRDLEAAKAFAMRSLEEGGRPSWKDAARYRLARIERKLRGRGSATENSGAEELRTQQT